MNSFDLRSEPFGICLAVGCQERADGSFCPAHWRELTADECLGIFQVLARCDLEGYRSAVVDIRHRLFANVCGQSRASARGVGFVVLRCVRPKGHEGDHDYALMK